VTADRESQALATVTRNANTLAQLVEELLDVSRAITGKMRIELQPVAPAAVVEAALATVQPTAEAKGIRVECKVDAFTGAVLADTGRLQQVVWNLLANAIKFTGEGGTIYVRLRRTGSFVEIEVADTGVGIEPSTLPFVFERFRQGENATTRAHGLGLGRAIVRHLVEHHGGEVSADSAGIGRGATFTVRLPLATGRSSGMVEVPAAPPTFEPAPQLRGLRVLAVDDEDDANELVRAVLQTSGVEVTTASSVEEALALLGKLDPHVLISDIGMPGLDGYAFIQEVRKQHDPARSRIPAIAITAFARTHDRSRAFLAGFDVYLPKPIDPAELVAVLCNLADRRSSQVRIVEPDPASPTSRVLADTRILVVDDDEDNAEMLAAILELSGATTQTAHSADEGMATIKSFHPHVLVSDIGLPGKDGFAFVRELRAMGSDDGGWIPAIALSGHADSEHAQQAILAGFQLHVAKPIDPPDLIARLARLVGRTARRT
jgi:CheY-like chemotaxis protein/anti-sigma regulatory factor (Ser/Thr protein kinase)